MITSGPALVVTTDPAPLKFVPVREMPPMALVLRLCAVESPLPAICVMVAAVIFPALALATLVTVKSPKRFVAPTGAANVIFPAPASKVRDWPVRLSTGLLNTILAPGPLVLNVVGPAKFSGVSNTIPPLSVITEPLVFNTPEPRFVICTDPT